jgi:hypothetical protein
MVVGPKQGANYALTKESAIPIGIRRHMSVGLSDLMLTPLLPEGHSRLTEMVPDNPDWVDFSVSHTA